MYLNNISFENPILKTIGNVADNFNIEVYTVGGYVRDHLLGKDVKDIDFVVIGDGPQFAEKVAKALNSTQITTYRKFGTAMVKHEKNILEFVGARKESYRGESRNPEVEQADLLTDLSRRDFTINAIAVSLNKNTYGNVIDPFNGQKDLKKKIIRTPLEPMKTFFDDPLRIMRAIRFATRLNFQIARKTKEALFNEKERLKIISQERITEELLKIIASQKPSIGLDIMEQTGVLELVLPEISDLKGVDERGHFKHKDVFIHTLQVLNNISDVSTKLDLRLAALFHDVAKPLTKQFNPDTGWSFHGHEDLGARMMNRIGKHLRLSNETIRYIKKLIYLHLRPIHLAEEGVTDSAIRRLIFNAGDDIDDLITLCRADITSGNPKRVAQHLANFDHVVQRVQEVEEKDRLRQFQPPVRGDEIMKICGIKPGPLVGKIKTAIEEAILNGEISNDHESAYQFLLDIKDQYLNETFQG